MKPKYRRRVVNVQKKGRQLQRRNLGQEDLVRLRNELYVLYSQVAGKARFRLFTLSPDFFIQLKHTFPGYFFCEGYFADDTLVGFTTRIYNNNHLEGYTHGLSYECNKRYELYQNFILDDIQAAINNSNFQVNTGRTSIAMKSALGAVAVAMTCYIRFSEGHINLLTKPLLHFIRTSNESCRHPFKTPVQPAT